VPGVLCDIISSCMTELGLTRLFPGKAHEFP
jgi:hypothetical protein